MHSIGNIWEVIHNLPINNENSIKRNTSKSNIIRNIFKVKIHFAAALCTGF